MSGPVLAGSQSSMTVRTALWWVTAVALGAWVAMHFTLVLLYSLPANPISQELRGTTGAYIVPLFSQS